jgi:DNA invertase Pin-like site-specific DNA recombinase
LDRLARSLKQLLEIVGKLDKKGIGLRSIKENIDTTTPGGKLVFHIFGSLAEFEREVILERTNAGLAAARARGRKGGHPFKFDAKKAAMAKRLLEEPDASVNDVCKALGVSRSTLYRHLPKAKISKPRIYRQTPHFFMLSFY